MVEESFKNRKKQICFFEFEVKLPLIYVFIFFPFLYFLFVLGIIISEMGLIWSNRLPGFHAIWKNEARYCSKGVTWLPRKLGSMVSKWVITPRSPFVSRWNNTLTLTIYLEILKLEAPQNQQSSCQQEWYFPMFSRYTSFLGHPSTEISLRSRIIWKTLTGVTWVARELKLIPFVKAPSLSTSGIPFFLANLLGFDLSWCFCLMASIPWDEIFTTFHHHQFGEAFPSGDALWPRGSSTWMSRWKGSVGYDQWVITPVYSM